VLFSWLSKAHIRAAYGPVEYSEKEARLVLEAARTVIEIVRELGEQIFAEN